MGSCSRLVSVSLLRTDQQLLAPDDDVRDQVSKLTLGGRHLPQQPDRESARVNQQPDRDRESAMAARSRLHALSTIGGSLTVTFCMLLLAVVNHLPDRDRDSQNYETAMRGWETSSRQVMDSAGRSRQSVGAVVYVCVRFGHRRSRETVEQYACKVRAS